MKYALRRAERRGAGHYKFCLSKTGGKELTFPPVFGADGEICALGGHGLVRRIANKPPHSGHRSRLTYALTHLTMRKQWISTVCRTALFVGKQRVSAVLSSVETSDLRNLLDCLPPLKSHSTWP